MIANKTFVLMENQKIFAKLRQGRPRWGRFGRTTKYQLFEQVDRSRAGRGSTCTEWWWRRRRRSSTFWLRSRSSILSTAPVPLLSSAGAQLGWLSCWASLCWYFWLSRTDLLRMPARIDKTHAHVCSALPGFLTELCYSLRHLLRIIQDIRLL